MTANLAIAQLLLSIALSILTLIWGGLSIPPESTTPKRGVQTSGVPALDTQRTHRDERLHAVGTPLYRASLVREPRTP